MKQSNVMVKYKLTKRNNFNDNNNIDAIVHARVLNNYYANDVPILF